MGYTASDKERAFKIFYETGNLSETVKIIKTDNGFKSLSKSTLSNWALEKNASGENWYERRAKIEKHHHQALDDEMAKDRKQILKEASQFKQKLYDQLPYLEAKTLEGAVNSYQSIASFILKQSGEDRGSQETAMEAVQALLLAIRSDDKLGQLLDERWPTIEKSFYTNLENMRKKKK